MATYARSLRRGLPRVPGGDAWPPAGVVPAWVSAGISDAGVSDTAPSSPPAPAATSEAAPASPAEPVEAATELAPAAGSALARGASGRVLRQGLPRVPGGQPWPPEGTQAGTAPTEPATQETSAEPAVSVPVESVPAESVPAPQSAATAASTASAEPAAATPVAGAGGPVRRGLPRVPGGEPWPPEGTAPAWTVKRETDADDTTPAEATPAAAAVEEAPPVAAAASVAEVPVSPESVVAMDEPVADDAPVATTKPAKPAREPVVWRGKSVAKWIQLAVLWGFGAVAAAGILVLAARGVTTLPGVPEWMERYPGHYDLPEGAEPGFPWWARWTHTFNIFLMALIIQSGLRIRNQQQPPAFYTPKRGGKKVSINLWLHTSLDVLWVINGIAFVVMLFVSGHWMRIIPTSWEVFPNALSAGLQYLTLEWPVENGWVNYNSLQQLMYFTIVFVAAPVAMITGARMSAWWPQDAKINTWYPAPVARALHFPTMVFFSLFIVGHVTLVFATGALRNLNHMFAGQDVVNWTGFWLFALTILVTGVLLWAARPLVLAPVASLFGRVSNR